MRKGASAAFAAEHGLRLPFGSKQGAVAAQSVDQVAQTRGLTDRPFALNLFVLPDDVEPDMAAVARARARLDALMEREGLDARTALPARWAPRYSEQFAALCEARPAVASFAFGLPAPAQMQELQRV